MELNIKELVQHCGSRRDTARMIRSRLSHGFIARLLAGGGGGVYTKNSLCMTYLPLDWKSREPRGTKALPQVGSRRWEMKNWIRAEGSGVPEESSAARQGEMLAQDFQPQHPHSSLRWPRVGGSILGGNGDLQELLARGISVRWQYGTGTASSSSLIPVKIAAKVYLISFSLTIPRVLAGNKLPLTPHPSTLSCFIFHFFSHFADFSTVENTPPGLPTPSQAQINSVICRCVMRLCWIYLAALIARFTSPLSLLSTDSCLVFKNEIKTFAKELTGFFAGFSGRNKEWVWFGLSGPLAPAGRCDAPGAESRAVAAEGAAGPRDQRRIFPG